MTQFRTFLPANRANTITLNLVAWLIMALKQAFTFTKDANDEDVYGKWDAAVCNLDRLERIKKWLLE